MPLPGFRQRLADFLEVPNIGVIKCRCSLKRSTRRRAFCKQPGFVGIVEIVGYVAFAKYLFQPWANRLLPLDTIPLQIRRLRKGIPPLRRFFYQIPEESDSIPDIRHESPSDVSVRNLTAFR
jgi:hypothetical protein